MTEGFKPTPDQKHILSKVSDKLRNSPVVRIDILPSLTQFEFEQVMGTFALLILRVNKLKILSVDPSPISDLGSEDLRHFVHKHSAPLINNPPGARNLREVKQGFEDSIPGYSRRGQKS